MLIASLYPTNSPFPVSLRVERARRRQRRGGLLRHLWASAPGDRRGWLWRACGWGGRATEAGTERTMAWRATCCAGGWATNLQRSAGRRVLAPASPGARPVANGDGKQENLARGGWLRLRRARITAAGLPATYCNAPCLPCLDAQDERMSQTLRRCIQKGERGRSGACLRRKKRAAAASASSRYC